MGRGARRHAALLPISQVITWMPYKGGTPWSCALDMEWIDRSGEDELVAIEQGDRAADNYNRVVFVEGRARVWR